MQTRSSWGKTRDDRISAGKESCSSPLLPLHLPFRGLLPFEPSLWRPLSGTDTNAQAFRNLADGLESSGLAQRIGTATRLAPVDERCLAVVLLACAHRVQG